MFIADVWPGSHGTSRATKRRPSSVSLAISISNASIPSSNPFVHDTTFAAPFDHSLELVGSFIIKYDDACDAIQARIRQTPALTCKGIALESNMLVLLGKKPR